MTKKIESQLQAAFNELKGSSQGNTEKEEALFEVLDTLISSVKEILVEQAERKNSLDEISKSLEEIGSQQGVSESIKKQVEAQRRILNEMSQRVATKESPAGADELIKGLSDIRSAYDSSISANSRALLAITEALQALSAVDYSQQLDGISKSITDRQPPTGYDMDVVEMDKGHISKIKIKVLR